MDALILLRYLTRLDNNSIRGLANFGATQQIKEMARDILAIRCIQFFFISKKRKHSIS